MIDCLDKQQQPQQQQQQQQPLTTHQFWFQQQHQQSSAVNNANNQLSGQNMAMLPDGQVIQQPNQQAALQQLQHQPPHYNQKHAADLELGQQHQASNSSISINNNNNNNELIGYYFGSISRETAEWVLKNHGNQLDGAYLLRSSGPKDDFVLSLMVAHEPSDETNHQQVANTNNSGNLARASNPGARQPLLEVLHYKIVETEDSFVALHGQVGDEKFATIDELIEKAQGVATKPKWPIQRQSLESQILPPTFWGLTVDQVRLAILIKAKQWGFPLSIFQQPSAPGYQQQQQQHFDSSPQQYVVNASGQIEAFGNNNTHGSQPDSLNGCDSVSQVNASNNVAPANATTTTTLNNETIRTLIYKSLHEFQPWFHGKISRDEAERRIEDGQPRDGRFLVRERDNYSYAMCISHKKTTKHYRIDVLPTGELAIQDGRKFTSLMALVSHYTIMSDGLWCALTESCPRPISSAPVAGSNVGRLANHQMAVSQSQANNSNNVYCIPPSSSFANQQDGFQQAQRAAAAAAAAANSAPLDNGAVRQLDQQHNGKRQHHAAPQQQAGGGGGALICPNQSAAVLSIRAPIKEWLHTINHKWSQLIASKTNQQHQSLNSFLFGSSNPLNNHCRHQRNHHNNHHHNHHHHHHNHADHPARHARDHNHNRRRCKNNGCSKHEQQVASSVAEGAQSRQHKAHQTPSSNVRSQTMARASCDSCCCANSVTAYAPQDGQVLAGNSQTMIQSRMLAPVACGPLKSLPPNNLDLQYIGGHANGTGGGGGAGDQLVTGGGGGGAPTTTNGKLAGATPQQQAMDYTKALLSCLPQNSGFMLDSQSFIGSPLFAVKTHNGAATTSAAPIDGFASRNGISCNGGGGGLGGNRANSMNGPGLGAGGSGSGSGGCGSGNNVAGGEEKLISPARYRSISANLNSHQAAQPATNPYALNTDIYGSQTSTAIVNDHLLTSSSSSSGNNNGNGNFGLQRQQSIDLKQRVNAAALQANLGQARYGGTAAAAAASSNHSQLNGLKLVSGGCGGQQKSSHPPVRAGFAHQQHTNYPGAAQFGAPPAQMGNLQGVELATSRQQPAANQIGAVQHAGPIVCGQHAGPAYRYTNCTGDQAVFGSCYHSRGLGAAAHRALDDSQLMTPSCQLGGPAALTKFVQFQDGQCLRTHRDTRSIQMAYLLSRQEALNVLNSRNNANLAGGSMRSAAAASQQAQQLPVTMQNGLAATLNGHSSSQNNGNRLAHQNHRQFTTTNGLFIDSQHQRPRPPQLQTHNHHQQQQQQPHQLGQQTSAVQSGAPLSAGGFSDGHNAHQQDQADFDLMDCDGNGFQFKYDPKLIKSSSIETLCGVGDGDDDDDACLEDLSNFKTNSELLMSLKSCWPNNVHGAQQRPGLDILSPTVPASSNGTAAAAAAAANQADKLGEFMENCALDGAQFDEHAGCLTSLMSGGDAAGGHGSSNNQTGGGLDESLRKKHDLDDLTTSLLAELTASLRAQVELKNKRSGLGSASNNNTNHASHENANRQNQQQQQQQQQQQNNGVINQREGQDKVAASSELNPRELIDEFDTLVAHNNA